MSITAHKEIDRVCNAIFQAIFERRLEPNTRLVETQLAKALSSNRSSVRQALLLLEQRKLVELVPNKGAVIAEPSEKDAAEVFAARHCIEKQILELVIKQRTAKDLEHLRSHLEREGRARENQQRHDLIFLTGRFHLLLAEISGNQVFLDFLNHLIARSSLILEKYESQGYSNCKEGDHKELVRLIAEGDKVQAQTLLTQHLEAVQQCLNFTEISQPNNLQEVFASMDLS